MTRPVRTSGFTLVELLVAFMVMIAVLGTSWVAVSGVLENQRITENDRNLAQIRERLIDFAVRNGRLPCPADPQQPGGVGLGEEWMVDNGAARVCASIPLPLAAPPAPYTASGALPWVTLRVPETDPWGQRYAYTVDGSWAEIDALCDPIGLPRPPGCSRDPALVTPSLRVVTRTQPGGSSPAIAIDLAAVVASHGTNGLGGFGSDAVRRALPPAVAQDELSNTLNPTGTGPGFTIVPSVSLARRDRTPGASGCNDAIGPAFCDFDDQLTFIPRHILVARLVDAGRIR